MKKNRTLKNSKEEEYMKKKKKKKKETKKQSVDGSSESYDDTYTLSVDSYSESVDFGTDNRQSLDDSESLSKSEDTETDDHGGDDSEPIKLRRAMSITRLGFYKIMLDKDLSQNALVSLTHFILVILYR